MDLLPAQSHDIAITRDIQIRMPDGVVLLADHYAPRGDVQLPTLLVRSPYGRKGFFAAKGTGVECEFGRLFHNNDQLSGSKWIAGKGQQSVVT